MTPEERRKVNAVIQGSQQHGQLKQQWGGGGYNTRTPATFRQEFGNQQRQEQAAMRAGPIAQMPAAATAQGPSWLQQKLAVARENLPNTGAVIEQGGADIEQAEKLGMLPAAGAAMRAGAAGAVALGVDALNAAGKQLAPVRQGYQALTGQEITPAGAAPRSPVAVAPKPTDGFTLTESSPTRLTFSPNNYIESDTPGGKAAIARMAETYAKEGVKTMADLAARVNTVPPDAMRRLTGGEPMGREQTPAVNPGLARMQQDQAEYDRTWSNALRGYNDPRSTSGASKAVADAMRMIERGDKKSIRQAGADLLAGYQEMAALEQQQGQKGGGGTDPQLARLQYDMMNDAQQRQYNQQKDQRDFTIQQSSAERAMEKERREGIQAVQPMWETSLDPVGVRSTALQLNELYGADLATTTALYEAEVGQLSDKVRKDPEQMAKARNAIMEKLSQAYQE